LGGDTAEGRDGVMVMMEKMTEPKISQSVIIKSHSVGSRREMTL
jgi:hypothetical protein